MVVGHRKTLHSVIELDHLFALTSQSSVKHFYDPPGRHEHMRLVSVLALEIAFCMLRARIRRQRAGFSKITTVDSAVLG